MLLTSEFYSNVNSLFITNTGAHDPLHFSQKQLPRKMKLRLVIIVCAGYIFWQLFLWELYLGAYHNIVYDTLEILMYSYVYHILHVYSILHCTLYDNNIT